MEWKNGEIDAMKDALKNHTLQEVKTRSQLHREFVAFDSKDVHIDYLVAFKRRRTYCLSAVEGTVRHVSKRTVSHGRPVSFCGKKPEKCEEKLLFPLCDCGETAWVTYRDDNVTRYGCGKYSACGFHKEYASVSKEKDLWRLEDPGPTYGGYSDHYECCCC